MTRKPKSRKSILLRICVFAFVAYAAVYLVDMQVALTSRRQELEQLRVQYEVQRLANLELKRQLETGTDEEYIERVARDKLQFVDPDERIYYDISGS